MSQQGFDVVPHVLLDAREAPKDVRHKIESMDPAGYAYPVDGLIVEYDDLAFGRALGATGHHENRLMALKWQDTLYETAFRGLEDNPYRYGEYYRLV